MFICKWWLLVSPPDLPQVPGGLLSTGGHHLHIQDRSGGRAGSLPLVQAGCVEGHTDARTPTSESPLQGTVSLRPTHQPGATSLLSCTGGVTPLPPLPLALVPEGWALPPCALRGFLRLHDLEERGSQV